MYTKIGSVIMWVGVAAGFIGSIPFGVCMGKAFNNGFAGFMFVLVGWIVTALVFTAYGIFIEMSANIRKGRKILEAMATGSKANLKEAMEGTEDEPYDLIASIKKRVIGDSWVCTGCGYRNKGEDLFCAKCRKYKSVCENKWYCSKCGQKNDMSYPYCTVCSQRRLSDTITPTTSSIFKPRHWECKKCGEPENDEFSYICKKCHRSKY